MSAMTLEEAVKNLTPDELRRACGNFTDEEKESDDYVEFEEEKGNYTNTQVFWKGKLITSTTNFHLDLEEYKSEIEKEKNETCISCGKKVVGDGVDDDQCRTCWQWVCDDCIDYEETGISFCPEHRLEHLKAREQNT